MHHADGLGDLEQVAAQGLDVVEDADALELGVETADEAGVLGRHADGTMVGVALLGLDAAHCQHRLPAGVDEVRAEREGDDRVLRDAQLAGADEGEVVAESGPGEPAVDLGETDAERVGHRIGEDHRGRPGAALATVDVDEVDAAAAPGHLRHEVVPELHVADGRLDPDRESGLGRDQLDEVQHRVDVVEGGVPAGRGTVDARLDPADLGDLRADLGAGKHSAEAGLGPLRELDLDRADRRGRHQVPQAGEVEGATGIAAAEVGGADLEDQVAALAVVGRDGTLAGVVQAAGHLGTAVQCLDGVLGERAEAHPGDVDDRGRSEGVRAATGSAEDLGRRQRHLLAGVGGRGGARAGERAVLDGREAGAALEVVVGPEAEVVVLELRGGVDPPALVAAERPLLVVARDDVLPQLGAEPLQQEPEVPDHGEVADDGVPALGEVVRGDGTEGGGGGGDDPGPLHGAGLALDGPVVEDVGARSRFRVWI